MADAPRVPGRKRRFTDAEMSEECECHCERKRHEDGTGTCWLCYEDEYHCGKFRAHHTVSGGRS